MHSTKQCFKCGILQPLSCFYKHNLMADGHLNKCKTCTKKDVKQNREKNIDYYKEYDKQRDQFPSRIKQKLDYRNTEKGKIAVKKSNENWNENNKIKRAVHVVFGNYIRNNNHLKPLSCENCNQEKRLNAHHDSYREPLNVRWLCSKCHIKWHNENEPII